MNQLCSQGALPFRPVSQCKNPQPPALGRCRAHNAKAVFATKNKEKQESLDQMLRESCVGVSGCVSVRMSVRVWWCIHRQMHRAESGGDHNREDSPLLRMGNSFQACAASASSNQQPMETTPNTTEQSHTTNMPVQTPMSRKTAPSINSTLCFPYCLLPWPDRGSSTAEKGSMHL